MIKNTIFTTRLPLRCRRSAPASLRVARGRSGTGFLFLLFTAVAVWGAGSNALPEKPNIFVITADDLAPYLGCYGYGQIHSPSIDSFAKEGMLFREAHAVTTVCSSSRTSILTGIRPDTSGLYTLKHDYRRSMPNVVTLPKHFSNNGYYTRSLGKVSDRRGGSTFPEEWDEYNGDLSIEPQRVIDALGDLKERKDPWLFMVGIMDNHCNWHPAPKHAQYYDINTISLEGRPGRTLGKHQPRGYAPPSGPLPETISDEQAKDIILRYYAIITQVDEKVGAIFKGMKEMGLWDNTIVIFWCGDHGFHLGENGTWGKWEAYRADSWVPMIVRVPWLNKPGAEVPALVETVDLYPSLVELAGLPMPASEPSQEGTSWVPLLHVPDQPWKKAVFVFDTHENFRSVKTLKYDYLVDKNGANEQLYDMCADPKETTNILQQYPEVAARMRQLMADGWRKAVPQNPVYQE